MKIIVDPGEYDMQIFELVLLLLACVMVSAVLDQIVSQMSLPLIQIAVGFVIALIMPSLAEISVDSELFMMMFIAPLLFREARETSVIQLWHNKWSVLSMAIGLVIVTVMVAGYTLHWIIPSIPLACAFACAAALGPTDAAAVSALGSTISLTNRQSILLSGESLINDASGVVSFQFAIMAAVSGSFSLASAAGSFSILFFGGIALGMVIGYLAKSLMRYLRYRGYVSTTTHVIYEVLSPFLIYLIAEEIGVSGVLAVVAAGLVMQEHVGHLASPDAARQEMVSNSFWEVIVFLINGIIFVMLGMQLPKVMQADAMEGIPVHIVLLAMLAVMAAVLIMRFLWVSVMELMRKDHKTGMRGIRNTARTLHEALITTIAGPKGAVTLSIILTIPVYMDDGSMFPHRTLIIFLTSGVILCTLLLADFILPKLAPREDVSKGSVQLEKARIAVLEGVIAEMKQMLEDNPHSEYAPAARLALMRYRVRLMRQRFDMGEEGAKTTQLVREVLDVQQKRADEIQGASDTEIHLVTALPYYSLLPGIRASIGYFGGAEKIGSRFKSARGRLMLRIFRLRHNKFDTEKSARIYYDTCIFAVDLENTAIDYLKKVEDGDDPDRSKIAQVLIQEHEAALRSLWGRLNYGQDAPQDETRLDHGVHEHLPEGFKNNTADQFRMARRCSDEVDANSLEMELDQIRKLRMEGRITSAEAKQLREEVYLMQTVFLE